MKIKEIMKSNQPSTYKKLNQTPKKKKKKKEKLQFEDFEELMRHDSYSRHRGAIRQR